MQVHVAMLCSNACEGEGFHLQCGYKKLNTRSIVCWGGGVAVVYRQVEYDDVTDSVLQKQGGYIPTS